MSSPSNPSCPASLDGRLRRLLAACAEGREVPWDEQAVQRTGIWLGLLERWRHRTDLTAARDEDELVDLMVADAAQLAMVLPADCDVVDVGTGAGAPGLGLGLLRPDLRVTLIEPLQKRVAFLRTVIGTLGPSIASRVTLEPCRSDAVARAFDVAVSRATLPPEQWFEEGARLAPKGQVWLLLAKLAIPRHDGWSVVADKAYRWPLTGATRRLVGLTSISG